MNSTPLRLIPFALFALIANVAFATHPVQDAPLRVLLNGLNEIGPNGEIGVGDPDGFATAELTTDGHGFLDFEITYANITGDAVSGLHIHGPGATPLTNHPIFIDLLGNLLEPIAPPTLPGGTIRGQIFKQDLFDEVFAVFDNPHEFYLNLHTSGAGGFPNGAVRGMLPEPGCLALAAISMFLMQWRTKR